MRDALGERLLDGSDDELGAELFRAAVAELDKLGKFVPGLRSELQRSDDLVDELQLCTLACVVRPLHIR